jgi:hypothetical protein
LREDGKAGAPGWWRHEGRDELHEGTQRGLDAERPGLEGQPENELDAAVTGEGDDAVVEDR